MEARVVVTMPASLPGAILREPGASSSVAAYHKVMSALARQDYLTVQEYLAREREAETRSEYWNGRVVAMAGGTSAHDIIGNNIRALLWTQFRGRPCIMYGDNMKVGVERANLFRYPDASALCGPVAFFDRTQDAYCNPAPIVEVLSPSTAAYVRREKFALFALIDSLREYLLVAQDRIEVELHRREPDGRWSTVAHDAPEDVVTLESIGCELLVRDIYEKAEPSAGAR